MEEQEVQESSSYKKKRKNTGDAEGKKKKIKTDEELSLQRLKNVS
jgi:hypothetical protein